MSKEMMVTLAAIAAAPFLKPVFHWIAFTPGKKVHDFLWKRLPEGRVRRILLRKV
jgi:hypothetical protein